MSKVTCFNCSAEVYQKIVDVSTGDPVEAGQFKGINGFNDPTDGDIITCPNCGDLPGIKLGLQRATGHDIA